MTATGLATGGSTTASEPRASIRRAVPGDLDAVLRLTHETSRVSYSPFLGAAAVRDYLDSGAADHYLAEHIEDGWVITLDGRIVGVAVVEKHVIGQLMIDHRHHRQGLGARLLANVETRLFERYDELELQSFEANTVANRFYRACGWTEAERRPDAEYGIPMIVFRKRRAELPSEHP